METDIESDKETTVQTTVEFLDCYRVQITGDYEDVFLGATFRADGNQTGTVVDSVGSVDGERTIDAAAEFDLPTDSTVLEYVEPFESEPTAPGLGDERVDNPAFEDCYEDRLSGHRSGTDTGDPIEFLDCETVRVAESTEDVVLSLFWWDEDGSVGTIKEPVGRVDGDRTIAASEEFGDFAYGPIVTEVELFDAGRSRRRKRHAVESGRRILCRVDSRRVRRPR